MTGEEVQKIVVLINNYLVQTSTLLTTRGTDIDEVLSDIEECCNALNTLLDELIDDMTAIAADYSATYTGYICQQQNNEDIDFTVEFSNYLCKQVEIATTTTTTVASTTTTTIDPDQVDWEIVFGNYLCQADPDEDLTEKSEEVEWVATYPFDSYICAMIDDPFATTTTTDPFATTTTTTYVDPEDVNFSATYKDYVCMQDDNPLYDEGITTTTTFIDEDDVNWGIYFGNYLCQQEFYTTTTTELATTTTTTEEEVTTTTTLEMTECGTLISGTETFPSTYWIDAGSNTGEMQLIVNSFDAPDRYQVFIDGIKVLDTGYCGDVSFQSQLNTALIAQSALPSLITEPSSKVFTFNKTSATNIVVVKVFAPIEETQWEFTLNCVGDLVTTTTTEGVEDYDATYINYICEQESDGNTTTTTPASVTTTTEEMPPVYEINCGAAEHTGGQTFPTIYLVIGLGTDTGYVTLTYDTVGIPDRFVIEMDGLPVLDTGYVGDTNLQGVLNTALASYGQSPATVIAGNSGSQMFYKSSATTFAIVKVWAPIKESEWTFSLSCPDDTITTTTTPEVITTTTTPVAVTTTTTNASPISSANAVDNERTTGCDEFIYLTPADFTYADSEGDILEKVKIVSYTLIGNGTLKYNGVTVTNNQILTVVGGAAGSFVYNLVYTPDISLYFPYSDTIQFLVKTANNVNYG